MTEIDSYRIRPSAVVPHALFETDALPTAERFDVWRESVLPLFDSIPDASNLAEFSARVESFNLGTMFFGTSAFTELRFNRGTSHAAGEEADHFLVQLYMEGGYKGHNGYRDVTVNPGDISLLDLGRTLETRARKSNVLSLIIPRELVYLFGDSRDLAYGTVIRAGSPMGNILTDHLLSVWRNMPSASIEDLDSINRMLLGAITGAFTSGAAGCPQNGAIADGITLGAIRSYIRQNLQTDTLSPEHLCQRFNCSRAQLYRMFAPLGGVSSYIREARLNRCLEQFTRFGGDKQKVIDVALQWGFSSHSHFCRLFKQAFGISPSEAIERGHAQAIAPTLRTASTSSTKPTFHDWLRHLDAAA